MKIEIRGRNVTISSALEEHVARKLDFALRRFRGRVDGIIVRLVDLNGPKGGLDKRCRIIARLAAPAPSVIVEAIEYDAYAAVSQAAARLDERVARAVTRPASRAVLRRRRYRSLPPDEIRRWARAYERSVR